MSRRDVIVVGARCAGAPLAMLLARRGHDVLLVDRVTFPKDTISTLYIHRPGVVLLERWGLLDRLVETGCPAIDRVRWHLEDVELAGRLPEHEGGADTYAPRRTVLDHLLVQAAGDAGAEVAEGASVTGVIGRDGRVAGVRLRSGSGEHDVPARMVVGADGMFSTIAREVDAATVREAPALTISYYAIYDMPGPRTGSEVFVGDRVGGARAPTHDGRTLVAISWPRDASDEVRRDLDGSFQRAIEDLPGLAEQVGAGRQVEPVAGMRRLPNVIRRSHGPGWALAGDAGYVKDPITAQGITDAFHDAQSLADAIDAGLRGESDLDGALAAHQRQRDEAAAPFFEWTLRTAELRPLKPRTRQLFQAIAADDQATTDFLGINAKLTDPDAFFAPANTSAILQAAT